MFEDDVAVVTRNQANSDFKSSMINCLTELGFSLDDLASIDHLLDDIISDSDLDRLKSIALKHKSEIKSSQAKLEQAKKDATDAATSSKSKGNKVNDIQDLEFAKKRPEAAPLVSKFTTPPEFPNAANALAEDYPNSYGEIDTSHNWFKVNKTTKAVEYVHNSGSSIKIDKEGNVSIHITGSLKFIIDGDSLVNIAGSSDDAVMGDRYELTAGKMLEDIGATLVSNVGSSITENTPSVVHNTPSTTHTGNVSTAGNTSIGGNVVTKGSTASKGGITGVGGLSFERHIHDHTDSRGDSGVTSAPHN